MVSMTTTGTGQAVANGSENMDGPDGTPWGSHRIFKYGADDVGEYRIPYDDAEVVHASQQHQSEFPMIWAKVDARDGGSGMSVFQCVGTGHPINRDDVVVASAVCGEFVWHVIRVEPIKCL